MRAAVIIPVVIVGAFVLTMFMFLIFPTSRPAFMRVWFLRGKGFTQAASAEDALLKLRKALETRNYEAAQLYLTGEYAEQFARGRKSAEALARACDELRGTMEAQGVHSPRIARVLYWLDPLPPFRHTITQEEDGDVIAVLDWGEDAGKVNIPSAAPVRVVDPRLLHGLLISGTPLPMEISVRVVQEDDGWKVTFPVEYDGRHIRDCVDVLEAYAGNYRNALRVIRERVRNDPAFKQHVEQNFFDDLTLAE